MRDSLIQVQLPPPPPKKKIGEMPYGGFYVELLFIIITEYTFIVTEFSGFDDVNGSALNCVVTGNIG